MIQRYCGGVVPAAAFEPQDAPDVELRRAVDDAITLATQAASAFEFRTSLRETWSLISPLNK